MLTKMASSQLCCNKTRASCPLFCQATIKPFISNCRGLRLVVKLAGLLLRHSSVIPASMMQIQIPEKKSSGHGSVFLGFTTFSQCSKMCQRV
eukprot:13852.XXX_216601_216876_1 [CDS] Oithona nana genome sequencing.